MEASIELEVFAGRYVSHRLIQNKRIDRDNPGKVIRMLMSFGIFDSVHLGFIDKDVISQGMHSASVINLDSFDF